ncbi:macrophage colony-stimulating factor 1 receptor isoform X2 [Mixophyes fleayi]|uniref:macrophage colony-stimulating factor 1 receptor isoform X2 n=1 Tax=Mixophyes fleayi TaxID=3061075 RepID=UPI003F4DCE79
MGTAALTLLILTSVRYGLATPVIEPVMSEIILQKDDSVTLTCHGNATVEWKLTSNQMKHIQQDNNTVVQIVKATYTDTGTYKCVYASNSSESASVHLFVKDAAEYWNTLVPRVLVDEYTDAVLPCLLTDPSVPKSMIFLKPTKRDQKTPVASFNTKTGYTIHNAQRDYQGSYVCLAKVNGVDKKSKEIQLFVKKVARKPPSVTLESKKHIRIQGEAFHMNCTAASIAKPAIKWKHTTKNITGDSRLDVSENTWIIISTVQIPSVDFDDSGNYTCVGENTAGSNRTSANLQVIEKAFINISTSENTTISLTVGDSVALTVDIEAYPHLRSWTWKHDKSDNAGNAYNNYLQWNLQPNGPYRSRSTLSLNRMKETESGIYTFYAENSKTSAFLNFKIILKTLPSVEIHQILSDGSQKMICTAWGIPLPTIQWLQCPGTSCISKETVPLTDNVTEKIDNNQVISVLNLEENISNATIFCFASNIVGNKSAEILLSTTVLAMTSQVEHMLFNPMLISMTVVGAFLLLLSVFLFYKCQQKPKYEVRWQIVQVSEGNHYTCIDPTQLPYNEKWEFPRANLHFGKTLGAGAFGKVMEATAFGMGKDDSALRVAVKMLKPSAHSDEVEALMSELKILSHLGNHQNIVNLLGACTSGGPILVITEYCQHGDLLNFLRKKAEALNSMFTETLAESTGNYKNMSVEQNDSGFGSKDNSSNVDMKPATSKTNSKQGDLLEDEEDVDDHLPLDLHDLLNFSLQVAQGMSFLASKNCIHRDVAARNVLVTQGRLAKICDFGLARDIENDSNYVVKGNARLPVKWMAPESIFDCIYTVQSDVWSYGILLWEMFSLGRSPYTGIIVNRKFYKMIKEGYKMDCPDYAPIEIYRLMKSCWDLEPTLRPTFNQITDIINRQMNLIKDQEYANIIQGQEDEQCMDVKCVDIQEPLMKGNNYQFR